MRVFVTRGSGASGRHVVFRLVVEGHDVRASCANAVMIDEPNVVIHQMTGLAGSSNLRHFDRAFSSTNHLRTERTRKLLEAASKAGPRRLVVQSFSWWTDEWNGSPGTDETAALDPHPPKSIPQGLEAMAALEKMAATAAEVQGPEKMCRDHRRLQ
jgi:2-alkyl-3-oxoalkanoate reductase